MAKLTANNKGLSAMLADEYRLIDISIPSCRPGCTNKSQHNNITSTSAILLGCGSRLIDDGISTLLKDLYVVMKR